MVDGIIIIIINKIYFWRPISDEPKAVIEALWIKRWVRLGPHAK